MTKFIKVHDSFSGEIVILNVNVIIAVYCGKNGYTYILTESYKRSNWGFSVCESVEEILAMLDKNN